MKYKHILLDMDGTIIESAPGIISSYEKTFQFFGVDYSGENLQEIIGPPIKQNMAKYVKYAKEGQDVNDFVMKYREYFSEKGIYENTLYPGVKELLINICENGGKVYVASSKPVVYLERILDYHGISQYFSYIGGDNLEGTMGDKAEIITDVLTANSIKKEDALMVGDRKFDIIGANACGVDNVGVLYGYGSRTELEDAGATYIVEDAASIYKIITGK